MNINPRHVSFAYVVAGIVIGVVLSKLSVWNNPRHSAVENAFVLGVNVKFKSIEDKEEFKNLMRPMAKYVAKYELDTISYEVLDSDKDSTLIYILERYKNKHAYTDVHRQSKEFIDFRQKFQ